MEDYDEFYNPGKTVEKDSVNIKVLTQTESPKGNISTRQEINNFEFLERGPPVSTKFLKRKAYVAYLSITFRLTIMELKGLHARRSLRKKILTVIMKPSFRRKPCSDCPMAPAKTNFCRQSF